MWYLIVSIPDLCTLTYFEEEVRAGCFVFDVLRMSYYCKCSATFPHGAVGSSAFCDCGISLSYSHTFCINHQMHQQYTSNLTHVKQAIRAFCDTPTTLTLLATVDDLVKVFGTRSGLKNLQANQDLNSLPIYR